MNFSTALHTHLKAHSAAEAQDVLKFCYQAARGAEHLLTDTAAARRYFDAEYEAVQAQDGPLCEPLSEKFCRVHMRAWKAAGLPGEWLFAMFASSVADTADTGAETEEYLHEAGDMIAECGMDPAVWAETLRRWRDSGMNAVHHSEAFRTAYAPAYRLVSCRMVRLIPILRAAAEYRGDAPCIIAIDGRAASGKSTMAEQLNKILGASMVHMDDFFLPPALRTAERLSEAGGNVHYERFCEEVLDNLKSSAPFSYRRFECSVMDFRGKREVDAAPFRIVEGSYSLHPAFGDYADISIFSDVNPEEQMRRITVRNGDRLAEMFRTRWIPLEESYFNVCAVRERAEITV